MTVISLPSPGMAPAADEIRGPFPILSVPYTETGAVDYGDLAKEARFVSTSGCPGVVWCQSGDAIDLLTFAEKTNGYEACAAALEGAPTVLALGVNGTKAEMLALAAAAERTAAAHPRTKIALISRPPDDGRTQADIRAYYEALAGVARRPVILQTYVSPDCPAPEVGLLVDLARRHPAVYGWIKEESEGAQANGRMAAEVAAKPVVKTVFSAWGGWQWLYQSRRIGSEGVVSERCAYAPLLAYIWRQMEAGDPRRTVTPAYALYRLLIDQREFPAGLRGYILYYYQRLGVFKTGVSRVYEHVDPKNPDAPAPGTDSHAWKPGVMRLTEAQKAELDACYDDMMKFIERETDHGQTGR